MSFAVISGPATLNGTTLTFTGVGPVTVQATQSGNGTYPPAPPVSDTFTVTQASQTITFPNPGPLGSSTGPVTLTATASSGLPVTYTVISGPGTVSGSTLTVTGVGNIVVEADQAGNTDYLPAPPVQITIQVVQGTYDTTTLSLSSNSVAPDTAVTLTASVSSSTSGTIRGQVLFCNASAALCEGPAILGSAWVITSGSAAGTASIHRTFGPGSYSIQAVYQGTNIYAASMSTAATLTVSGSLPTTTTVSASSTSGTYTLTGDIFAAGTTAPTGTATFFDVTTNTQLASVALSSGTETTGFLFASVSSPVTTSNNQAIAVGDFNNDGNLDYVVANQGASATATVMLGNGSGTFTAQSTTYPAGNSPEAAVVADFNGDGKLDIAFANASSNGVTILLGNGDGTFTSPASQPAITNAAAIAVGDFNGDGIPDLAVSNNGSVVTILLGNGDGTFTVGSSTTVPTWSINPEGIVAMDFNGDGKLDLAVTSANANSPASYQVTILLGNGDGTFTAGNSYPTGNGDQSIAGGDFNGDGKPDLAIANYNDNTVTVLLGNGDGTFTAAGSPVSTGTAPFAIVAADLNNDGKLDLVTANYSANTVTFLLGHGDGTFAASATAPSVGGEPDGVVVGDFNGDGLVDVITANSQVTTESVLLQATSSTVVTAAGLTVAATDNVYGQYGGDTNFNPSQSVTAALDSLLPPQTINFPNPGPQNYGTPLTLTATATSGLPVSFAVISGPATLSGNTLTFTGVGSVTVQATQDGGGTYAPAPPVNQTFTVSAGSQTINFPNPGPQAYGTPLTLTATATSGLPVSFAVTAGPATLSGNTLTFTGVGSVTVEATQSGNSTYAPAPPVDQTFTVNQASQTITFPNPGPLATSTPPVTLTATASSGLPVTYTLISGPGTLSGSTLTVTGAGNIVVEADQAGNADYLPAPPVQITILVVKPLSTITTINSAGTSGNYTLIGTVWAGGTVAPTGDVSFFDVTSDTQLATVPLSSGTVTTGFLFASTSSPATASQKNQAIAIGDFNKDGNLDYVVANLVAIQGGPSTATIMLGDGKGNFTAQPTTYSAGNSPIAAVVADFNGDGKLDIAFSNSDTNGVTILLGNGDGTFSSPASQPSLAYGSAIAVGDFNGDGKLDLAVSSNNNSNYVVTILLGNGDGTFTAAPNPTTLPSWSINPEGIVAMDFNGDGKLDLAVTSANTNSPTNYVVTILLGKGDGTFTTGSTYTTGNGDQSMVGGDFNGDSKPDLAIANYYDNTVTVLLGNGDGTFTAATGSPVSTGSGPFAITAGDFNNDGKLDLVTADYSASAVTILLGNGDGTFTASSTTPSIPGGPDGLAVGDFNGDGLLDIVTANYNSTTQSVLIQATSETTVTASGLNIPGTDNVYAKYSGNNIFLPSQSPTVTVSSVVIVPASQTITFPNPSPLPNGVAPVTLTATASSGLPVTYSLISGPGTISGSTLTVTGAGSIVVEADQAGNALYAAAPPVQITITVVAGSFTIVPPSTAGGTLIIAGEPATVPVTVYFVSGFTGSMSFTCTTPAAMLGSSCSASTAQITGNKPVAVNVSVSTTARSQTASLAWPKPWQALPTGIAFAMVLVASGAGRSKKLRKTAPLAVLIVIMFAGLVSCGGTGGSTKTGAGTPAGNYTLTLVGTSGSSSYTASVNVAVQ